MSYISAKSRNSNYCHPVIRAETQKTAIIKWQSEELAVDIKVLSSLLRLDEDYSQEDITALIKQCTSNIEWQNGYSLIHKKIEITHSNTTIIVPQAPIHKIISVKKKELKTGVTTDIPEEHYSCATDGKYGYIQILHTAFSTEELKLLGLIELNESEKRYHKHRMVFVVEYEAGIPSSKTGLSVAEFVPEVFKTAVIKEAMRVLRDSRCASTKNHHIDVANDISINEHRVFVGKI
jgi:hypothetical protein